MSPLLDRTEDDFGVTVPLLVGLFRAEDGFDALGFSTFSDFSVLFATDLLEFFLCGDLIVDVDLTVGDLMACVFAFGSG